MNTISTTCARCDELSSSGKLDVPTTTTCARCGVTITESVAEDAQCVECRYHSPQPKPPPPFDLIDLTTPAPPPRLSLEERILCQIEDADTFDGQIAAIEAGIDQARDSGRLEGLKIAVDLIAGTSIGAALRRVMTNETLEKCAEDAGLSRQAISKAEAKIRQNRSRLTAAPSVERSLC